MRDQIGEVARARLLASPYSAIRSIGCSCHDGVLTLRGTLSNYHQKQLTLAIVADIEGVQGFVDKIQVASRLSGE